MSCARRAGVGVVKSLSQSVADERARYRARILYVEARIDGVTDGVGIVEHALEAQSTPLAASGLDQRCLDVETNTEWRAE